jgi:hypothetical protein
MNSDQIMTCSIVGIVLHSPGSPLYQANFILSDVDSETIMVRFLVWKGNKRFLNITFPVLKRFTNEVDDCKTRA